MNDNNSSGCGFLVGVLFALGLLGFGAVSCASWAKNESRHMRMTAGGGVAAGVYDKHRANNPGWNGSARKIAPVGSLPASKSSVGNRCVDNPYAQTAANTYGVPIALIECIHFAESRCRSNDNIQGKHSAWSAVSNLKKPTKQRHAIHVIADDLGINVSDLRSNRVGAMGPFQFIPTTWISNGVDANRDGDINPYSLADSTFAAANMFAKVKANKGSWRAAITRYNAKPAYVNKVASCAGLSSEAY